MKIALAQMNPTVGDLATNARRITDFSRRASDRGAELVIFPEMGIGGYPPRDLVEKADFIAANQDWLRHASLSVPDITILCGCATPAAVSTGKSVHNSALCLRAGDILFQQSKMLLPTYDVFDELRNFAPAEQQKVWQLGPARIAVTICEDAWNDKNYWPRKNVRLLYPRDPVAEQMRMGADFLVNISASPFETGKIGLRQEMLSAIAREYRVPVLFVNQVGGNDQLVFDGTSLVMGPGGTLRARAASFEEDLLVVDSSDWRGDVRAAPASEIEAIFRALVLGTRDYVRKCGFEQVLVGLSGGIDSALTAVIAAEALGRDHVLAVGMPSRYSSLGSLEDSRVLAHRLGIRFVEVPIEPPFRALLEAVEGQYPPDGSRAADLTEQNLQSRIRGVLLMAFSNRTGAMVLTTGNKSELATGYCTLYGDMVGGLAVLADVLKTQVYELARFVNRECEIIPRAILEKPPSAELKPDQTDQDDLPPYEVLDAVIRDYVENYRTPEQIAAGRDLPLTLVSRLIRRIDHSEYKRQQAAPGLKVSRKAFGMGRRLPIAQRYEAPPQPGDTLPAMVEESARA